MPQHIEKRPGGWPRNRRYDSFARRLWEAWQILTDQHSFHRAWQSGYDERSSQAMSEILQQARRVRNFSDPNKVFEAIPVRALGCEASGSCDDSRNPAIKNPS